MLFITEKRPGLRIYVSRLRRWITFEDGRYETFDLDEIAALERNPYVTNFTEDVERPLSEPSPLDPPELLEVDEIRFTDASGGTRFVGRVTSEDEDDAGPASAD